MTRPLAVLVATALLSAASLRQSLVGGPTDIPFAVAVLLAIAVTLTAATARGRGWPALPGARRLGSLLLVAAAATAVLDRRLVVASRGPSPDELLLVALVLAVPLLALARVPARRRETIFIGLTLATYALVGVALIVGKPYHVDAVIAPHRAAELLLAGRDPYREFDFLEAAARFRIDPALVTHLTDGTQVRGYDYPALSFVVVTPLVAVGVGAVRWLYLAELLVLALVVAGRAPDRWRSLAVAAVVGNVMITRQYVLAGIDPTWLLLVAVGWLSLGRRWPSALAIGLAVAARQTAWFVAPFYLLAILWQQGPREALRRAAIAGGTALAVHPPFLLDAPAEVVRGVLTPIIASLESNGVGLVRLGLSGALPLLPREVHALLAVAAYAVAALAFQHGSARSGGLALALAPLYLAWRSSQSYFAFVPLLALLSVEDAGQETRNGSDLIPSTARELRERDGQADNGEVRR